jgi:hypothetical protein
LEVRQRLAAYLRSQARRLDTLADALASGEVKCVEKHPNSRRDEQANSRSRH